jgi:hypothetical protein
LDQSNQSSSPRARAIHGKGWKKVDGEWVPDVEQPAARSPPAQPAPELGAFELDLDSSHVRITNALAVATRRLELQAPTGLSLDDLNALEQLARVWRTLEANIEKAAERVIEKAVKRELARLGPNEQPEEHGQPERGVLENGERPGRAGADGHDEADAPDE